jgi:hypothetical protein
MNAEVTVRHDLSLEEMCRAAQLDPRLAVPILGKYPQRRKMKTFARARFHLVRTLPPNPGGMEYLLAATNSPLIIHQVNALVVAAGTVRDEGGNKYCPAFHVRDGEVRLIEVPLSQPNRGLGETQVFYLAIN